MVLSINPNDAQTIINKYGTPNTGGAPLLSKNSTGNLSANISPNNPTVQKNVATINSGGGIPLTNGQKASSPQSNVKPASNSIPSGQIDTVAKAQAAGTYDAQNGTGSYNSALSSGQNPTLTKSPNSSVPNGSVLGTSQTAPPATPIPTQTSSAPDVSQNGYYGQLIQGLVNQSSQPSAGYTNAVNQAENYNNQLTQSRTNEANSLAGISNEAIPLNFQQGRSQVLQSQYAAQQAALGAGFQGASTLTGAANTQQGLQQAGLTSAAGLTQPVQVPYSNQYINPVTGQPVGGGTAGSLPADAQSAVDSYAQQVRSGQMTRADAESRLSAYGVAGTNALNSALGSGFNTNASNASAATTQQGQQLQTAATATNQALGTLTSLYNGLPSLLKLSIPGLNSLGSSVEGFLGSSQLTAYKQTLADARAQLQGVLTASGAATPTGAESAALTYLPDNMTPGQLQSAIANVQQLIQQKVQSFTQSGSQTGQSNSSGNVQYNSDGTLQSVSF